jgi:hypothetical protein
MKKPNVPNNGGNEQSGAEGRQPAEESRFENEGGHLRNEGRASPDRKPIGNDPYQAENNDFSRSRRSRERESAGTSR